MKKIILALLLISMNLLVVPLQGQNDEYNYFYRIYFKDKGENHISDFTLSELFTQRAIERREKNGIAGPDFKDIPVSKEYLDIISSMGLKLHCTSRWMNTGLFKSSEPMDINSLLALPFVNEVKIVKNPVGKGEFKDKFAFEQSNLTYGWDYPIVMLNGDVVQSSGFNGDGIIIAVLDVGFMNTDKISSLLDLRTNHGILETYDFVEKSRFVYDYHKHGTAVLSVLVGEFSQNLFGSSPSANILLLRTEYPFSEFPVEEDFWAAGAEFADSAGCDIISSSLGYYQFDDPSMDYKYSDMDGKTTFVTQAAEAAFSRGIVVVNSAGNEGATDWKYIIAPSDGVNIISVGAVDYKKHITLFSSVGPSSDGRIKPDVMALGYGVPHQADLPDPGWGESSSIVLGSGTSFSCPIISGMIACLMQAVPEAKASEIISAIREVSDRFDSPDNEYGYGIPDMVKAVEILQRKFIHIPSEVLAIGPNPFTDYINVTFRENPEKLRVEIFDSFGRPVWYRDYINYISLYKTLHDFQNLRPGLYFLRLSIAQGTFTYKLIKAGK